MSARQRRPACGGSMGLVSLLGQPTTLDVVPGCGAAAPDPTQQMTFLGQLQKKTERLKTALRTVALTYSKLSNYLDGIVYMCWSRPFASAALNDKKMLFDVTRPS